MNDMYYFINECQLYGYADDNTLSKAKKNAEAYTRSLDSDATSTLSWFENNHMRANPDKFHAIGLGMKIPETLNFQLGNITIKSEDKVKLLGIDLDSKLNFYCHIHTICQKAAKQINALKRLSKFTTFESRMAIFRSFIMSNFNYCSLVWHACGVQITRKLEKLQERALRFVYLYKVSSYDDLLTKANLTTLHLGRLKMLAPEVYKSVHKLNPPYIQEIYKTKTTITHRRLRGQNNLHIPRVNSTTYGLNSSAYQGAKIWNGLSQDLKSAISLDSFKRLLRTWTGESCRCAFCRSDTFRFTFTINL